MTRVRVSRATVTDRASATIDSGMRRAGAEIACGLLLGWREGATCWVDRALVCRNAAPDRHSGFAIDPGVLLNVRRSLETSALSIVGFYYTGGYGREGVPGEPTPLDLDNLRRWPEMVWLIALPMGQSARAWWMDPGGVAPREISIFTASSRLAFASCPD